MFVNPGGPGDTGVGLVRGAGAAEGFDEWGDGRFDVVSWDPRGTNASTPVRCFRSKRSERRFWKGASIPTTGAASRALSAQDRRPGAALRPGQRLAAAAHLDRRHRPRPRPPASPRRRLQAHLRRPLLRHLPRPDLRQPVPRPGQGDDARRRRRSGRVLEGCRGEGRQRRLRKRRGLREVPLAVRERGRRGAARSPVAPAPRPSGSSGCSRGWQRAPIPAPGASPPGKLSYGDLLLSQFSPMRSPDLWPQDAKDLDAALGGDGSALETEARKWRTPAGWSAATTSAAISCADAPARTGSRELATGDRPAQPDQLSPGPRAGLVAVGPVRLLAGARPRTATGARGAPRPPTRSC